MFCSRSAYLVLTVASIVTYRVRIILEQFEWSRLESWTAERPLTGCNGWRNGQSVIINLVGDDLAPELIVIDLQIAELYFR